MRDVVSTSTKMKVLKTSLQIREALKTSLSARKALKTSPQIREALKTSPQIREALKTSPQIRETQDLFTAKGHSRPLHREGALKTSSPRRGTLTLT